MTLFTENINNWQDWSRVFQSIPAFSLLSEHVLRLENLPAAQIENLTPGTNAVFKAGKYVIKLFAPNESGIDQTIDLQTELFAAERANKLGISAPKLVAHGFVEDKYRFAYMIMEYIEGSEFTEAVKTMTKAEKVETGHRLREITDKMNMPCEPFNSIDAINDIDRSKRWDKYPERFRQERINYIKAHDYGEKVFAHGDLCGDNILLSPRGELYIIDFADAVLAPVVYEHALVAVELFNFDNDLLRGYFGNYSVDELTEICFNGILIHDFGGDIVEYRIGKAERFQGLHDLRRLIRLKIEGS